MSQSNDSTTGTSRRDFLAKTVGGATAVGLGALGSDTVLSSPDTFDLDISLFTTKNLVDDATALGRTEYHAAHVVEALCDHILPTLSTDTTEVTADVTIVEEPIPDTVTGGGFTDALYTLRTYIEQNLGQHGARHSNLLLGLPSDFTAPPEVLGKAELPLWDFPLRRLPIGAVNTGSELLTTDATRVKRGLYSGYLVNLLAPIHEIGHNLGFHHTQGHATTDQNWAEQHIHGPVSKATQRNIAHRSMVYSTVMLNDYPRISYGGTENAFGERIPAMDAGDELAVIPTFNPALDVSHLYTHFPSI